MKKTMKGGSTTKQRKSSYTRTSNNIYFDGYSYRVRMTIDGVVYSKNFTSKKKAYEYRKQLTEGRVA
jgi:hypothetical protein